jgi:copper chaperone NosL
MNPTIDRRRLLVGAAALALVGCGGSADASKPPKIDYGHDTCERCRMIISEERQAAALVAGDGKKTLFDDTGEMIATVQENGLASGQRVWVHDYGSEAWIDGTKALFVAGPEIMTPMGTGLVAFKERSAADELAASHEVTPLTWDEVLQNWRIDTRMS